MKTFRARTSLEIAGFTLIELLTVIAILAVLAALTSHTLHVARERGRFAQCRAELAYLAQALEDYKRAQGDYPVGSEAAEIAAARLCAALMGSSEEPNPKFEAARLSIGVSSTGDPLLLDPWGGPYRYFYRTAPGATWIAPGHILLSAGPDGQGVGPDDTGRFAGGRRAAPVNADNVFADDPP